MPQLDPYPAARVPFPNGQSEDVIRGPIVEGTHALDVREAKDGLEAVVIVGDGGKGPAFGNTIDVIG